MYRKPRFSPQVKIIEDTLGIILSIYLLLNFSNISFAEGIQDLPKEKLFNIYSIRLSELNLSTVNKESIKFSDFIILDYKLDKRFEKKIAVVSCKLTGFGMEIDPLSGKIVGCQNYAISHEYASHRLYEGGAKPNKSKEDIISEAKNYIIILNGEIPKEAYFDEAVYKVQFWQDAAHSYKGEWFISWGRKEGDYKYRDDSIIIILDEEYGLHGYGYNFFSNYNPPQRINISKDRAIEIAKNNIDHMINSSSGGGPDLYKDNGIKTSELKIVNPNYFHDPKRYKIVPSSYARLAWVMIFDCVGRDPIKVKEELAELAPRKVEIWIDAETGEVLGGG